MRGIHSAVVRFAIGAAFVALVALGAILAELDAIVIVALIAVACVLVALVWRLYAREAAHARQKAAAADDSPSEELAAPTHVEAGPAEPKPEPEPAKEPELAVSKRSARAILASGPPPVQERPPRKLELESEPKTQPEADPEPEPEPERGPRDSDRPREWNVWELQRLVRERPHDDRQEEWAAMVVSLRDFARADGTLPPEFDELVRDSFGSLLAGNGAQTEVAAVP